MSNDDTNYSEEMIVIVTREIEEELNDYESDKVTRVKKVPKIQKIIKEETTKEPKKRGRKPNPLYYTDGQFDHKKYSALNKVKERERVGKLVECECGMHLRRDKIISHRKTSKHAKVMVLRAIKKENEVGEKVEDDGK